MVFFFGLGLVGCGEVGSGVKIRFYRRKIETLIVCSCSAPVGMSDLRSYLLSSRLFFEWEVAHLISLIGH